MTMWSDASFNSSSGVTRQIVCPILRLGKRSHENHNAEGLEVRAFGLVSSGSDVYSSRPDVSTLGAIPFLKLVAGLSRDDILPKLCNTPPAKSGTTTLAQAAMVYVIRNNKSGDER